MSRQVALNLISQGAALVSIVTLYVASVGIPGHEETWDGEESIQRERRNKKLAWAVGIPAAIMSVGCQTILTIWP
jgi:hypothetical protein